MDEFVSQKAEKLWDIFKETGDVNVYLLYHAVQYSNDKLLDKYIGQEKSADGGMEL